MSKGHDSNSGFDRDDTAGVDCGPIEKTVDSVIGPVSESIDWRLQSLQEAQRSLLAELDLLWLRLDKYKNMAEPALVRELAAKIGVAKKRLDVVSSSLLTVENRLDKVASLLDTVDT